MHLLFQMLCKWNINHPNGNHISWRAGADLLPPLPYILRNTDFTFPQKWDVDEYIDEFHGTLNLFVANIKQIILINVFDC